MTIDFIKIELYQENNCIEAGPLRSSKYLSYWCDQG